MAPTVNKTPPIPEETKMSNATSQNNGDPEKLLSLDSGQILKTRIKKVALVLALGILLPTTDTFSDLKLTAWYYWKGHPHYATLLLTPFLVNYLLTWFAWWRMPYKNRHITWIFVALTIFPQYRAAVVIWHLYWVLEKGLAKKKVYEREISEVEIFTEAVPTVLILTNFLVQGQQDCAEYIVNVIRDGNNTLYKAFIAEDCETSTLIFGSTRYDVLMFLFTFVTSILSASLGLAKCLKVGPCRVLGEGGAMDGLCSPRFILLVLSSGCTLIGKGIAMACVLAFRWLGAWSVLFIAILFLPGFLLSLLSLCHYKTSFKDIFSHPSLVLLPVFTHFTFSFRPMYCSSRQKDVGRVQWSKICTLINIVLSLVGMCVMLTGWGKAAVSDRGKSSFLGFLYIGVIFLTVPIIGMILTLIFCYVDTCYCCCCCCCCSTPCSPDIQMGVLQPQDPLTEFVVGKDNELFTMGEWMRRQEDC